MGWCGPGAYAFCRCLSRFGRADDPFEKSEGEVGTCLLGGVQEELEFLLSIMTQIMSYASLVTYEGAANALSREGCRHFEAFDRSYEDFDQGVFQVEDDVLKRSAGALYDRIRGPHCHGVCWDWDDPVLSSCAIRRLSHIGCALGCL